MVRVSKLIDRLAKIPFLMKILILIGIFAPVLATLSIFSGKVAGFSLNVGDYGAAANIFELTLAISATTPIFIGSILLINKHKYSKITFVAGYYFLTLSPLALSGVRDKLEQYYSMLLFNVVLGLIIALYIYVGSRGYFQN